MRRILTAASFFLIILAALLTIVDILCFARPFYAYEYKKDNTAEKIGMTDEGLMNATDTLLQYIRGGRNNIVFKETINGVNREVFDERETLHMIDVKNLYRKAKRVRNFAALGGLFLLLSLFYGAGKEERKRLPQGFKDGACFMVMLVAFILIWCMVDFNGFWLQFHYLFFDNDLFLLDPSVSVMINMFPEVFFRDLVMAVILGFCLFMVALKLIVTRFAEGENA